jgi:hypothetical protein
LVVAEGISDERFILWSNDMVVSAGDAEGMVQAYVRRWAVEDANRVVKQEFWLEVIHVTDWQREQRPLLLVGIAYGFRLSDGEQRQASSEEVDQSGAPLTSTQEGYCLRRPQSVSYAVGPQDCKSDPRSVLGDFQRK